MLKSFIKRRVARKYSLGDLVKSNSPILAVVILACLDFFPFTPSLLAYSGLLRFGFGLFHVLQRKMKTRKTRQKLETLTKNDGT